MKIDKRYTCISEHGLFKAVNIWWKQKNKYYLSLYKRQRKPKGQSKKDNPEKLATQGTQDEEKQKKNTTQYVLDTI